MYIILYFRLEFCWDDAFLGEVNVALVLSTKIQRDVYVFCSGNIIDVITGHLH